MQIFAIYSLLNDKFIGRNNDLIIKDKYDLQHFKSETLGNTIIMGRKTVESLPKRLKNRTVIMLSSQERIKLQLLDNLKADLIVNSPREAINLAYTLNKNKVFIAGGASIYDIFADLLDGIIETRFYRNDFDSNQSGLIELPKSIKNWKETKTKHIVVSELESCVVCRFFKENPSQSQSEV